MTLPTVLTILSTAAFFALERLLPGRPLPHVSGWYSWALLVNFAQLGITLITARLWIEIFGPRSLFSLAAWDNPLLEGFVGWFIGTCVLLVASTETSKGILARLPSSASFSLSN
jgi:hypothetical protein